MPHGCRQISIGNNRAKVEKEIFVDRELVAINILKMKKVK